MNAELLLAYDKAKIKLMSSPKAVFFTTVCFSLRHIWDEKIKTACTDGLTIKFNPDFFMSLTGDQRVFLMLHETMHVAYEHALRLGSKDHSKWNEATDHVINLQLIEQGFSMPQLGLADKKFAGMSADQVYPLLPDKDRSNQDQDLLEPGDEGVAKETQKAIEDILVRANIHAQMMGNPGSVPGDIKIILERLLNPKLPWQTIFRTYIKAMDKSDYSFRKPNRRYMPEHYLPSLYGQCMMDLSIAIDASGSVSDSDFRRFVTEISGIFKMMKPSKITIVVFDTAIRSVDVVTSISELKRVEFTGRGGTRVEPVFEWARANKPELLVVFTDGDFHMPNDTKFGKGNLLWLINNNPRFKSTSGKVIHYDV